MRGRHFTLREAERVGEHAAEVAGKLLHGLRLEESASAPCIPTIQPGTASRRGGRLDVPSFTITRALRGRRMRTGRGGSGRRCVGSAWCARTSTTSMADWRRGAGTARPAQVVVAQGRRRQRAVERSRDGAADSSAGARWARRRLAANGWREAR